MAFNRTGLIISILSLGLTGCATQANNSKYLIPALISGSSSKLISIHETQIRYRDLSHPPDFSQASTTVPVKSAQPTQKANDSNSLAEQTLSISKSRALDEQEKALKEVPQRERLTVIPSEPIAKVAENFKTSTIDEDDYVTVSPSPENPPTTSKRIFLKPSKAASHYSFAGRGDNQTQFKQRAANSQRVGFWEWLFGKRKPEPQPAAIVKVVPKLDPAIVDQPNDVMFKHAKTDQLAGGQFKTILTLSEYANTTAVYEVRGTAGYLGETAERIGRERAEFIKNALINAGVSRTKIRIMDYDASFPGLRGVVTLRDSEAI